MTPEAPPLGQRQVNNDPGNGRNGPEEQKKKEDKIWFLLVVSLSVVDAHDKVLAFYIYNTMYIPYDFRSSVYVK